jgi:hypothetical protein
MTDECMSTAETASIDAVKFAAVIREVPELGESTTTAVRLEPLPKLGITSPDSRIPET